MAEQDKFRDRRAQGQFAGNTAELKDLLEAIEKILDRAHALDKGLGPDVADAATKLNNFIFKLEMPLSVAVLGMLRLVHKRLQRIRVVDIIPGDETNN